MTSGAPEGKAGDGDSVSFGYRTVAKEERQGLVNEVFATVAERYDLMNDLMSGGLHRLWKGDLVVALNPPRSASEFRVLDLAGGTGDVAMRIARAGGAGTSVVICDISPEMLEVGRRKVDAAGLSERVSVVEGNAEELPFADRSFDAVTIAFGIRNVTRTDKALREMHRVLKIGGRLLVLEFSHVDVAGLDRVYDLFSFEVIPRLGKLAAGSAEPYQYLVESIRKFPPQETFAELIRDAGFERVSFTNFTGGVAALHSGWKI